MGVFEAKRICSLSRRLELDKADEGFVHGDGVVRACLKILLRGFADCDNGPGVEVAECGSVFEQLLKRSAQLIFWLASRGRICQLTLRPFAEVRYSSLYAKAHLFISVLLCGRSSALLCNCFMET